VLDVGTGPGTIAFAINDFYQALRSFAEEQGIELLAGQTTEFSTVESNEHMQLFLAYFRESAGRCFPANSTYADFAKFSPQAERRRYYESLLSEEDWNEIEGVAEPAFTEYFANLEAQGVARFRCVVMSYFLTTPEGLKLFETALTELARDLRPGSVVILLGAPGHEPIHREVQTILDAGHFRRLLEVPEQLDTAGELEVTIKRGQQRVYEHIASIVGEHGLPRDGHPDYWNPEPHRRVQTEFRMTAFRKGRWPNNRKLNFGARQPPRLGVAGFEQH
jgi:SAM-dependent methyltransferase